jgi:hypothetical protein
LGKNIKKGADNMKNYQENVTATLWENAQGNKIIWIDDNDGVHVTNDGNDELIEEGTKEWYAILKKYAPIFIK